MNRIVGATDCSVNATLHRPNDPEQLAREARQLIGCGLTIRDAATAVGLSPLALARLLDDPHNNH